MRKKFLLIFSLLCFLLPINLVWAASFNLRSSANSVKPNGTFTISVGGDCIGRVNLSVSNGSLSSSSVWVEQNTQTITVTAGSSGSVTITATPQTGFSDSDANLYNPGARSVTVGINSGTSNPGTTNPVDKKSGNNKLKSLTIDSYELNPVFSEDTYLYTINLTEDVKTITINAVADHAKAKVTGAGEITLKPGTNVIEIEVVAENGAKKTYTIKAFVEEKPDVFIKYQNAEIGIVKNYEGVQIPEGFTEKTIEIDGKSVIAFSNSKMTIIYGVDKDNNKAFYLFDTEKNTITSALKPLNINEHPVYVMSLEKNKDDWKITKLSINDQEIEAYQNTKNDNYYLVQVMDNNGKIIYYLYEKSENSFQIFPEFLKDCSIETVKKSAPNYILLSILGVFICLTGYLFWQLQKRKNNHAKS